MAKLRVDKVVDGNTVWHEHGKEDAPDLVPYTGATQDVNLGSYDLEATEIRINATSDHTINNSSDDLLINNPNNNKKVTLQGTNGTYNSTLNFNSTNSSLTLSNTGTITNNSGIIIADGNYSIGSPMAAMWFKPVLSGAQGFYGFLVSPNMNSHTSTMFGMAFQPIITGRSANAQLDLINFQAGKVTNYNTQTSLYTETLSRQCLNIPGVIDDTGSVTHNGVAIGAGASFVNTGAGVSVNYTEQMIKLTGGISSYTNIGTGAVSQKGLIFSGFGSVAGGTCKALEANGGLFDYQFDKGTYSKTRYGAGNDASIAYNGTDLVIDAQEVGSGDVLFPKDNQALALGAGTGGDARIYYDGSHLYLDSNAVGSGNTRIGDSTNNVEIEPDGDVVFNGTSGLAFGEIYCYDTATTITITSSGIANKVQITAFAVNGHSNNATPDHTNDHITITKAGKYLVTISGSIESPGGGAAALYGFGGWINNGATQLQNIHTHRRLAGGGSDRGSISMSGICNFAVNDTVEVWTYNNTNTSDIIIDDMTLSIVQIGG